MAEEIKSANPDTPIKIITLGLILVIVGGGYKLFNIYSGHRHKPAPEAVYKPPRASLSGASASRMPSLVSISLWK
ncbi:MAG TPA: hypothetical protein VJJ20_03120 [Candidatus Paceibacterota bacterium]